MFGIPFNGHQSLFFIRRSKNCATGGVIDSRGGETSSDKPFEMRRYRDYCDSSPGNSHMLRKGLIRSPVNDTYPMCDTWAVITTSTGPTTIVRQLASIKDICVCVVADEESPDQYDVDGVVYLTPDIQVRKW